MKRNFLLVNDNRVAATTEDYQRQIFGESRIRTINVKEAEHTQKK